MNRRREEAEARAVAAERRSVEAGIEARREADVTREARFSEAEAKVAEVGEVAEASEQAARKRVHEIAKQQGMTSKEVLAALSAAGIEGKTAASSVDEDVALVAIVKQTSDTSETDAVEPDADSIAAMSAEAERLAEGAPAAEPADADLEPPSWVAEETDEAPSRSRSPSPNRSRSPNPRQSRSPNRSQSRSPNLSRKRSPRPRRSNSPRPRKPPRAP